MNDVFHLFALQDLRKLFPSDTNAKVAGDFLLAEVQYDESLQALKHPCRFDGYMIIFCKKGHFQIDMNLSTFDIHEGSLVIYLPDNIVKVHAVEGEPFEDSSFTVIATGASVIDDLRIDFTNLYKESMSLLNNPCITLSSKQQEVFDKYISISRDIMESGLQSARDALMTLASSAFYLLAAIWTHNVKEAKASMTTQTVRSKLIFENFINLVKEYHSSERNVAFYAEKLCLTPKYLSKLIKTISGRSAPDWIDSFVILEAKNMLKYSDMNIKEIVYRLHFPDQSSFYKFFKSRTGMIPSEYRQRG